MSKYKYVIVTCVRWDTDRIAEWLNYYRSLGFDHVYVYSNDDDPTELYQELLPYIVGDDRFVTFYYYRALGMQRWTLIHCLEHHGHEFEWIGQFDVDEYLSLRSFPDVGTFIEALQPADAVYINWVFFGNSGHKHRVPNLLLNYTRRQSSIDRHTRTITRRSAIETDLVRSIGFIDLRPFYHGWIGQLGEGMRRVNVLGHDMSNYYNDFDADARYVAEHRDELLATAVHQHYAFQSEDDFDRRVARGTAGEHANQPYWGNLSSSARENFLSEIGAIEDTTLRNYWIRYLAPAWNLAVLPAPEGPNLALGRPCRQSSIASGSVESAGEAVNGQLNFKPAFETEPQNNISVDPFWDVDLGDVHPIRSVLIFNRLDQFPERSANIRIWLSNDGQDFHLAFEKRDGIPFGGVDGNPLVWRPVNPVEGRFIRVSAVDKVPLHLAQVEVY